MKMKLIIFENFNKDEYLKECYWGKKANIE